LKFSPPPVRNLNNIKLANQINKKKLSKTNISNNSFNFGNQTVSENQAINLDESLHREFMKTNTNMSDNLFSYTRHNSKDTNFKISSNLFRSETFNDINPRRPVNREVSFENTFLCSSTLDLNKRIRHKINFQLTEQLETLNDKQIIRIGNTQDEKTDKIKPKFDVQNNKTSIDNSNITMLNPENSFKNNTNLIKKPSFVKIRKKSEFDYLKLDLSFDPSKNDTALNKVLDRVLKSPEIKEINKIQSGGSFALSSSMSKSPLRTPMNKSVMESFSIGTKNNNLKSRQKLAIFRENEISILKSKVSKQEYYLNISNLDKYEGSNKISPKNNKLLMNVGIATPRNSQNNNSVSQKTLTFNKHTINFTNNLLEMKDNINESYIEDLHFEFVRMNIKKKLMISKLEKMNSFDNITGNNDCESNNMSTVILQDEFFN